MNPPYQRAKFACYATNVSQAIVSNLPPILFLSFRSLYQISYSLLGLLVLINFCTQLAVDLLFSFFSHKINMAKAVKITPLLTVIGLVLYAASPYLFPTNIYLGLVLGTVIFSASGGFVEVLISPVIAAIPAENPEREMSKLHSIYAWGVVVLIPLSTLYLLAFDAQSWHWLVLLLSLIPLVAAILFCGAEIPKMETPARVSGALEMLKNKGVWLCIIAIFLGGASECTMAQWSSSYLEQALDIPKVWGDIFGVAMFALMLGLGRTFYGKYGKSIEKHLVWMAIGATACYLTAAISNVAVIGLVACALTGLCTAMMWPGMLIVASERFPTGGVFIFAIMAAGGDLGASVGPQLVGIITDAVALNPSAQSFAQTLALSPEQLGMKIGMLVGMLFPLVAIFIYGGLRQTANKKETT